MSYTDQAGPGNRERIEMRPVSEIEADLKKATEARNKFGAVCNEGTGGYVDESDIERLTGELLAAEDAAKDSEWTPEVIETRRAWFNAQKFTTPLQALEGCRAQGWEWNDLKKYSKK